MATRPPKRAADGCWQVFGLANLAAGGRMPTVRRFPGRLASAFWRRSFSLTAAGQSRNSTGFPSYGPASRKDGPQHWPSYRDRADPRQPSQKSSRQRVAGILSKHAFIFFFCEKEQTQRPHPCLLSDRSAAAERHRGRQQFPQIAAQDDCCTIPWRQTDAPILELQPPK